MTSAYIVIAILLVWLYLILASEDEKANDALKRIEKLERSAESPSLVMVSFPKMASTNDGWVVGFGAMTGNKKDETKTAVFDKA